jgi:hypothetical protein
VRLTRVFLSLVVLVVAALSGCSGGSGGGGTPPPPSANVNSSVVMSTSAPRCTANIHWQLQPVALTGQEGRSDSIDKVQSYDIPADLASKQCRFGYGELGLRFGTWRISAILGSFQSRCDVRLTAPSHIVTFILGANGCTSLP